MTVRLLVDWKNPADSKQYLVNNLLTTDAGTETGLVNAKLASSDLTGGTAWVAPPVVESVDEVYPLSLSTDSNGNTVLVGADGKIIPTLGANTITVGAGGMYATIAEAIAGITEAEMFVPTTPVSSPTSVSSWDNGDSIAYAVAFGNTGAQERLTERLWFRLAGDPRAYPVHSTNSRTPDSIVSRINRIDATIATPTAITYYRENPVCILLLDDTHAETVTIDRPVSLHISSIGKCAWMSETLDVSIMLTTPAATHYSITFGRGLVLVGGFTAESVPHAGMVLFDGCDHSTDNSDLHGFYAMGTVEYRNCDFKVFPIDAIGHFGLSTAMSGDIIIRDCTMTIGAHSHISAVKSYPWDTIVARNLIVDGLSVMLDDVEGRVTNIGLFGLHYPATLFGTYLSNVTVNSKYASTAVIVIADEMPYSTNDLTSVTTPVHLVNCHIGPNFTGATKNIYRASTGGSGRVVRFQACSGGLIGTPSVGSRTGTALVV